MTGTGQAGGCPADRGGGWGLLCAEAGTAGGRGRGGGTSLTGGFVGIKVAWKRQRGTIRAPIPFWLCGIWDVEGGGGPLKGTAGEQ